MLEILFEGWHSPLKVVTEPIYLARDSREIFDGESRDLLGRDIQNLEIYYQYLARRDLEKEICRFTFKILAKISCEINRFGYHF